MEKTDERIVRDYPEWYVDRIHERVKRYLNNKPAGKLLVLILLEKTLDEGPVMG